MSLRHETRLDLKAELERLTKRIVAIREILGDEDQAGKEPSVGAKPKSNGTPNGRTGLRKWIRDTVAASPGLKPAEVARRIGAAGYQSAAATPLVTRVHNETSRMTKPGGGLKKRNGRLYPSDRDVQERAADSTAGHER